MTDSDCFKTEHSLLPLEDALALINERVAAVTGSESLPLEECLGRILAEAVEAPHDQPPFANAAMDGYAIRFKEFAESGQRRLPVAARIAAGHPNRAILPPGCAVQIFTGAPLPDGFDCVVMQEDCAVEGDHVVLPEAIQAGSHCRAAGIDFKRGDVVVAQGSRLRPQEIGLMAAVGRTHLSVRKRLKIGLFSTGDELVPPGQALAPGQIHDSNRPMLRAALSLMGFEVHDLGHLGDQLEGLVTAFGLAALNHDVLISTGGVSVGGEDHVRGAIERLGTLHFWKIAVKPGKPLALGQIGKAYFLGLPGNPVSSLISLLLVGRALLHRLNGAKAELPPPFLLPAAAAMPRAGNRVNFLRGRIAANESGPMVLPYFNQDSSLISSLVASEGLIEVGIGSAPVETGELVAFRSYDSLFR